MILSTSKSKHLISFVIPASHQVCIVHTQSTNELVCKLCAWMIMCCTWFQKLNNHYLVMMYQGTRQAILRVPFHCKIRREPVKRLHQLHQHQLQQKIWYLIFAHVTIVCICDRVLCFDGQKVCMKGVMTSCNSKTNCLYLLCKA